MGAGIAGMSLAWALRRQGIEVVLFDAGPIPNPISSSFDEHRIIRHTYGSQHGYAALMPEAFRAYDRLWDDLGVQHYLPTGMVYVSRTDQDWYSRAAAQLDTVGMPHRLVPIAELASRLPMLSLDGVTSAYEAGGSGLLFADRIVRDLAHWLAENGVELHPNTRVDEIDANAGTLTAAGITHHADLVVVAAGAWLPTLLPATAARMVPSRQLLLYLEPPAHLAAAWAQAPILIDQDSKHGAYILPPRDGTRLKIGDHIFSRRGHGSDDRIATDQDIGPVAAAADAMFTGFADYRILERKVCYYTVTEHEDFVVEPIGSAGWVLSACSGHGFKLAPLIASGLADAIAGKRSATDLPRWAAGR